MRVGSYITIWTKLITWPSKVHSFHTKRGPCCGLIETNPRPLCSRRPGIESLDLLQALKQDARFTNRTRQRARMARLQKKTQLSELPYKKELLIRCIMLLDQPDCHHSWPLLDVSALFHTVTSVLFSLSVLAVGSPARCFACFLSLASAFYRIAPGVPQGLVLGHLLFSPSHALSRWSTFLIKTNCFISLLSWWHTLLIPQAVSWFSFFLW